MTDKLAPQHTALTAVKQDNRARVTRPRTLSLLVDDGVNSNSCLASLPVTDDELTLATANRDESINSLQTCLHRLVH
jgi:hypothetical protein